MFYNLVHDLFLSIKNSYVLRRPVILALIGTAVVLLFLKKEGWLDHISSSNPAQYTNHFVELNGVINSPPEEKLKGLTFEFKVDSLRVYPDDSFDPPTTHAADGVTLIQLMGSEKFGGVPGDRALIRGKLLSPKEAHVPGTFNFAEWLRNKNIYSLLYTSAKHVTVIGTTNEFRFSRWGWSAHKFFADVFEKELTPDQSAVLSGLVIGRRPRKELSIKNIFIDSGTMHILVASGSNVAFVMVIWFFITRFIFRLRRNITLLTSLPAVWAYVFITGSDAPIIRAGIMATVGVIAVVIGREDRPYQNLALAAFVLLLINPKNLFDVGFQMSFLTVFGLVYFLPHIEPFIRNLNSLVRWIIRILAGTATAQLWIFPITAQVFKKFIPTSLLSNLIILPLSSLGLPLGFLLVLFSKLTSFTSHFHGALSVARTLTRFYCDLLILAAQCFSDHLQFSFWIFPLSCLGVMGFYLCCLSLPYVKNKLWAKIFLIIGTSLIIGSDIIPRLIKKPPTDLTLTWIDIGRDSAILIQTPEKRTILIDPSKEISKDRDDKILFPALLSLGVRHLDETLMSSTTLHGRWEALSIETIPSSYDASDKPLLINYKTSSALIARNISLETQKELLKRHEQNIDLIQSRSSEKWLWNPEFVKRFQPHVWVEIGYRDNPEKKGIPWKNLAVVRPQKEGVWRWQKGNFKAGNSDEIFEKRK